MQQKKNNKITKKNLSRKRSLTRLMAVQILYQYHFFNQEDNGKKLIAEVIEDVVDNYVLQQQDDPSSYRQKIDIEFLTKLVTGVVVGLDEVNQDIIKLLQKNWTIEKLPDVMLEIIRIAVFELRFISEVPAKVAINEYVNIASSFYDEKKVTFVNSILDNIAKKYRKKEFENIKKLNHDDSKKTH